MLLKLVEEVRSLKEQVQRMADVMQKREERREDQAAYYKKRKGKKCKEAPRGLATWIGIVWRVCETGGCRRRRGARC